MHLTSATASAPARVAMINETMARRFFGGQSPLGRLLTLDLDGLRDRRFEIAGVLRDAKYNDLRAPIEPMLYLPLSQASYPIGSVEVRTAGDPLDVAPAVKRVLREADGNIMVSKTTTLARRVDDTLILETMLAELSGVFGVLALVLACVGLYGTMSYAVARRTSEIGIRMALGARRGEMLWMVLRETLLLVGDGCGDRAAGFDGGYTMASGLSVWAEADGSGNDRRRHFDIGGDRDARGISAREKSGARGSDDGFKI